MKKLLKIGTTTILGISSFIWLNYSSSTVYAYDWMDRLSGEDIQIKYNNQDFAFLIPTEFGVERNSSVNGGVFSFTKINKNSEIEFNQTIDPTTLYYGDTTYGSLKNGDTIIITTSNAATVFNANNVSRYNKESGNTHIYRNENNKLIEQSENARLAIEKVLSLFKNGKEENGVAKELSFETVQVARSLVSSLGSDELCWNSSTNKWMTKKSVMNLVDVASKTVTESSVSKNTTNFYDEIKNKINGLFTDSTHKAMKNEVTQHQLNEISSLINQLKDKSLKNSLLADYNKLNNWFNAIVPAEKAVYALFKDSDHKIVDLNTVNERSFYLAQTKVNQLSDGNKKDELNSLLNLISNKLTEENIAYIPDNNLRKALNSALNKGTNNYDQIKIKELKNLKGQLNLSYSDIINLQGIEYCTNINSLDLSGNHIRNIYANTFPLQLIKLNLEGNAIVDIHNLSKLTNLTELNISKQIRYIIDATVGFVDRNTIENPVKDENGATVPIKDKDIHYKANWYDSNTYPVKYDESTNQIHWDYDAYSGKCYTPGQPIILFSKKSINIGKATCDFTGAYYMPLENSWTPNNLQDNSVYNATKKLLNNL